MNRLVQAIKESCTEGAFRQLLLSESVDSPYSQQNWNESLCAAIDYNRPDLLSLLSEFSNKEHALNLNPVFPASKGADPLDYPLGRAVVKQVPQMVQKLIELGADVNKASHRKTYINDVGSFLHLAVLQANANAYIIKILLERGVKRYWVLPSLPIRMACTLALEQGSIGTFLEAVDGKLSQYELLEILCIHYQTKNQGNPEALLIEELAANNKIRMHAEEQAKENFEELQAERQALLSPQSFDFMKKFPPTEAWRFFVDGSKQQWYPLALMSEIKADNPEPGVLYLSEDGEHYLISKSDSDDAVVGSLVDLADLESGQERVASLKAAFQAWKINPKQDVEYKKLILEIALLRRQILLPQDTYNSSGFFAKTAHVVIEENGWCGYEQREPDCISKMCSALQKACLSSEALSLKSVSAIHQLAMNHEVGFEDKFNFMATYGLCPKKNLSLMGYLELCKQPYASWNTYSWLDSYRMLRVNKKPSCRENELEEFISHYTQAQKDTSPNDREQLLKNIIFLASSYARIHPRQDGNNRTAVILLNSELMKHGFLPTILEDPNRLEGYSQTELLQEVYQGMLHVRYVMEHGHYPGGKSTKEYQEAVTVPRLKTIPDTLIKSFSILIERMQEHASEKTFSLRK